jgi:hypothetical protein
VAGRRASGRDTTHTHPHPTDDGAPFHSTGEASTRSESLVGAVRPRSQPRVRTRSGVPWRSGSQRNNAGGEGRLAMTLRVTGGAHPTLTFWRQSHRRRLPLPPIWEASSRSRCVPARVNGSTTTTSLRRPSFTHGRHRSGPAEGESEEGAALVPTERKDVRAAPHNAHVVGAGRRLSVRPISAPDCRALRAGTGPRSARAASRDRSSLRSTITRKLWQWLRRIKSRRVQHDK